MDLVFEKLGKIGIVPVVVLDDAKDAEALGNSLMEGGLPCAEVTFRTQAAEESILTIDQVNRAWDAGSKFIVSPGLNPKIVEYCLNRGIPVCPGTCTPSDIERALEFGLDAVKFFPAEPSGGLKFIKAIAAPYTNVKFMPTGGINAQNVKDYLAYNRILACGGSWMVTKDLVKAGDFNKITDLVREAAQIVKDIRG